MAWAAQMERVAINERISAARARVETEGGRWGRPRRMDESQVRKAAELRGRGLSVRQVAKQLGLASSIVGRAVRAKPTAAA
jgi:DNA invertase Pin-like site-specific DNA recombinase